MNPQPPTPFFHRPTPTPTGCLAPVVAFVGCCALLGGAVAAFVYFLLLQTK